MTSVNFKNLKEFVLSSFIAMGLNKIDAEIFSDALMFSELRFQSGQGQGVQRMTTYSKRIKNIKKLRYWITFEMRFNFKV